MNSAEKLQLKNKCDLIALIEALEETKQIKATTAEIKKDTSMKKCDQIKCISFERFPKGSKVLLQNGKSACKSSSYCYWGNYEMLS